MTEHNIGVRETVAFVVMMTCAKVFLGMPRVLVELGGTAAWLVVLISMIHGPLIWLGVRGILRLHPGKTLITATEAILGPVLGTVVNLVYFGFFFALGVVVLREFAEGMVMIFLPTTPLPVVLLALLACVVYVTYLGLEAATRTAYLGGPFMLIGYVALLAAAVWTHAEPNALAPYWGTGADQVITWGLTQNLLGDLLLFGLVGPSFRTIKQWDRAVWWTIGLCTIILVGTQITYLYVFPYPSGARIVLPLMQVTRTISLGPALQRVESVFFVIWLVGSIIKLCGFLYFATSSMAQTLRLPVYRHLFVPFAVLTFTFALVPENVAENLMLDFGLRQFGGVVTVVLPLLTWGVGLLFRKEGRRHAIG